MRIAFFFKNFCNIINVFALTFDQFNASLLNKSCDFFQIKNPIEPMYLKAMLVMNTIFWNIGLYDAI